MTDTDTLIDLHNALAIRDETIRVQYKEYLASLEQKDERIAGLLNDLARVTEECEAAKRRADELGKRLAAQMAIVDTIGERVCQDCADMLVHWLGK